MKGLVVAIKGIESEKMVNGYRKKIVPFVGENEGSMGVGFLISGEGTGYLKGPIFPRLLLKSWRAMKLLENIWMIENGTLYHCWEAGSKDAGEESLNKLARQFISREKFDETRNEILLSAPSAEELDSMIIAFKGVNITDCGWELEEEAKEGRIKLTPAVQSVIEEVQKRQEKNIREQEEIKKPLSREESLAWFFYDMGICNFIFGDWLKGVYGWEYGHIELNTLDWRAKCDSFNENMPEGYFLKYTANGPETIGPWEIRRNSFTTNRDEIKNPSFTAANGITYTFLSAKYRDRQFFIRTRLGDPKTSSCDEEFTIFQLRVMFRVVPREGPPEQKEKMQTKVEKEKERFRDKVRRFICAG